MVIKINYTSSDVYVSTSVSPVYVVVNYSGVNSGDGNFVPYTGATGNVDLGEYELKSGQLTLDTSPTGTAAVGTTRWNDTIGSSETTLKGGNVILKNGVDLVARVVNKVSPNTTLTKAAYQAVRVSGAQGQRLAIALAQANNDANSADTIGLVTETIATNQEGFIMTVGSLEGINTTGSLQGETWADGDVIYLSGTTAGALTNVKPTAPIHIVIIGYVEYAHANNGKLYIRINVGYELDELHNVAISSPTDNQVLTYEASSSLWKNKTPTGGGTTIYTGDGTLSGNRGVTLSGSYLQFIGSDFTSKIFSTGRLSINRASSPLGLMHIQKNANSTEAHLFLSTPYPSSTPTSIVFQNNDFGGTGSGTGTFSWNTDGNAFSLSNALTINTGNITASAGNTIVPVGFGYYFGGGEYIKHSGTGSWHIDFVTNSTQRMRLTNAGRLLLGTTSESTYLLDVNGTARVSDNILVQKNQNNVTKLEVINTTGGNLAEAMIFLKCELGAGQFAKTSSTYTTYKTIRAGDFYIYNGSGGSSPAFGGNLTFLNDYSSGNINFTAGSASTAQMTLTAAGRLLLGTTTEGLYGLDVANYARVNELNVSNGYVTLGGTGAGRLLFTNSKITINFGSGASVSSGSSNVSIAGVANGDFSLAILGTVNTSSPASIAIGYGSYATGAASIAIGQGTSSEAGEFVAGNRETAERITNVYFGSGKIRAKSNSGSTAGVGIDYTINGSGAYGTDYAGGNITIAGGKGTGTGTSGDVIISTATTTTSGTTLQTLTSRWYVKGSNGTLSNVASPNASAQVQIDSTTQGFLPPRMTNAQRAAISSPAVGLIVYCTDATEGLYVYKSTGWTFVI